MGWQWMDEDDFGEQEGTCLQWRKSSYEMACSSDGFSRHWMEAACKVDGRIDWSTSTTIL